MWPYWLLFLLPAIIAILRPKPRSGLAKLGLHTWSLEWLFMFVFIALMIGYRHEVGGDWGNYFRYLDDAAGAALLDIVKSSDPGYMLINWISVQMGWSIYGVNMISGTVLSLGVTYFCRDLPRPWLALVVAVPYLIVVVGMGYSRQGVALGFAMLGLVALRRKSVVWFVIWILLGATFHKTAVLLLPIAALANTKNRYWTAAWVAIVMYGSYLFLLEDAVGYLYENYIEAEYQSEGAFVRVLMNALPSTVLLWKWKRFRISDDGGNLWRWMSIISLALFGVLFVSPSSTAVDRVALYMLPLQLAVFSYVPDAIGSRRRFNQDWVTVIVLYYAAVHFVWLNFAVHSRGWIPYRFYPLEGAL